MAGATKNSIIHFTHPPHPLTELCSETEYLCNGCHTFGVGNRYSCQSCNFNLHDYCASCPESLLSSMHPHPLARVSPDPHHERFCNLCNSHVQGIFYSCKLCDFHLHPICTQLPEHLRHVLDTSHPLSLQQPSSVPACCAVCGATCTFWHYGCGVCGLHIHLDCVLAPCGLPTGHRSFPPPQPQSPPPPNGAFANYGYGVPPAYTPYNNVYGYHVNYNQQPLPSFGYGHGYGYGYGPYGYGYGYGYGVDFGYGYGPYGYGYGYGYGVDHAYTHCSMYHENVNNYQPQPQPQSQPQAQAQDQAQGSCATNGRLGRRMFALVGSIAMGVLSNVIFGLLN